MAEWRYLPNGRTRHAIDPAPAVDEDTLGLAVSVCGAYALEPDEWHGTGTQDEYERVETLPACKRCASKVGPDDVSAPPERTSKRTMLARLERILNGANP
jgi:hypothetical protein